MCGDSKRSRDRGQSWLTYCVARYPGANRRRYSILARQAKEIGDLDAQVGKHVFACDFLIGFKLKRLLAGSKDCERAVIWIEHVVHALIAVADRVICIDRGRELAQGSPMDVMNDPAVQEIYLGDMLA